MTGSQGPPTVHTGSSHPCSGWRTGTEGGVGWEAAGVKRVLRRVSWVAAQPCREQASRPPSSHTHADSLPCEQGAWGAGDGAWGCALRHGRGVGAEGYPGLAACHLQRRAGHGRAGGVVLPPIVQHSPHHKTHYIEHTMGSQPPHPPSLSPPPYLGHVDTGGAHQRRWGAVLAVGSAVLHM